MKLEKTRLEPAGEGKDQTAIGTGAPTLVHLPVHLPCCAMLPGWRLTCTTRHGAAARALIPQRSAAALLRLLLARLALLQDVLLSESAPHTHAPSLHRRV